MSKFNIFRNGKIHARVEKVLDTMQDRTRNETEEYWRSTIANEIYDACPDMIHDGYPCQDCHEMFEFVLQKVKPSHDS